jgi:hypothetical protein
MSDYHFIYKTTCKITGEYYIGRHSTNNIHDDYLGSGKRLWASIYKYGIHNFERKILEYLPDKDSLIKREKEIVNESLLKDKLCINMVLGGDENLNTNSNYNNLSSANSKWETKWNNANSKWKKLKF